MKTDPLPNLLYGAVSLPLAFVMFQKAWFAYHHGGVALAGEWDWSEMYTWQAVILGLLLLVTGMYAIVATIVRALKHRSS